MTRSIPGPTTWQHVLSTLKGSRRDLGKHRTRYLEKYGDLYKERYGSLFVLHSYDPELFRICNSNDGKTPFRPLLPLLETANKRDGYQLGLGSLNGKSWETLRKPLKDAMMVPEAIDKLFLPWVNEVTDDLVCCMQKQLHKKRNIENFKSLLDKFVLEAICAVSLGVRMDLLPTKSRRFIFSSFNKEGEALMKDANEVFECVSRTQWGLALFRHFRTPTYRKFLRANAEASRIIRHKMFEASQLESCNQSVERTSLAIRLREEGLSESQVEAVVGEFLQAGIVATSASLSLLLYNLAKNQESQAELLRSIEPVRSQVLKSDLHSCPYLSACMKESFRLFAPVPGTFRVTTQSIKHNGYDIPANSGIFFNNQVMCKMEQYVTNPEEFKPERYLQRRSEETDKYSKPAAFVSVPFGHGARTCIGKRFAETLMSVATLKIIQNFHVTCQSDTPPRIESKIFTVPVGDLHFGFQTRNTSEKI